MSGAAEVQAVVVAAVAEALEVPAGAVELDAPLDELGLDSLELIKLAGDLSDRLGVFMDPTLSYEHPDIPSLSAHLARMAAAALPASTVPALPGRQRWITAPFATPRTAWQRRLATAAAEVVDVDRVGLYDPFAELGLDGGEGRAAWDAVLGALGVEVSDAVDAAEHVAGLAALLDDGDAGAATTPRTLEDESRLPDDIRPGAAAATPGRLETVLLTGATGYVGAYLLDELLRQSSARVVCLVRAPSADAGLARILANLERYDLPVTAVADRIDVVTGDLDTPRLGLDADTWTALAERIDVIVHNGAWVNFILPYQPLKAANVDGTVEVLRLATGQRTIPVHFISTLWILATDDDGLTRVVMEDEPTGNSEELPNGYEQSKWVADRLVQEAMRRGLPAAIHRLGLMSGEAAGGRYHQAGDFLSSFVKGCIQMNAMPMLDQELEMVPVDFTARVVVHAVLDEGSLGHCYHLTHPDAASATAAAPVLQDLGYPIRELDWEDWKTEFLTLGSALGDNALAPFLEFIRPVTPNQTGLPPLDLTNFRAAVASSGAECPSSMDLLARYVADFQRVGFLEAPEPGQEPASRAAPAARRG